MQGGLNMIKHSVLCLFVLFLFVSCKADTDFSSNQPPPPVDIKKEKLSPETRALFGNFDKVFESQQEEREIDEEEKEAIERARMVRLAVNQTIEELFNLDPDKDFKRIHQLGEDLKSMGEEARNAIGEMLSEDNSIRQQQLLIMVMGVFQDREAGRMLYEQALNSADKMVRGAAMQALNSFPDKEPFLEATLQNVKRLEVSKLPGETRDKQMTAIAMLGVVGGDRAIDELVYMLKSSEDEPVRKKAVEALGNIGSESVVDILFDILRNDGPLRQDAACALGRMHREEIIAGLGKVFLDVTGDPSIRLAAVEGLGEDNGALARSLLLNILKDTRQTREIHKKTIEKLQLGSGSELEKEAGLYVNLFASTSQDYLPQMLQQLVARGGDHSAGLLSGLYGGFNNLKKIHAIRTLGRIPTEKSFDILLNLMHLEKEADLRREIITALGGFNGDDQAEGVADLFSAITTTTEDKQERILALKTLGKVAPEMAAEIAEDNLFSSLDNDVILASIDMLKLFGNSGNKGALITLQMQGETSSYYARAEEAIRAIDARESAQ